MFIFIKIIQILIIPVLSPLGIGLVRKIKAHFQNRKGASVFQPYRDLWKLFHKDEIISKDASWIFKIAPFIVFTVTLAVAVSIPIFSTVFSDFFVSDILYIVYLLSFGTFFLALAGLDSGSPFGGFGSSREMTLSALAEGGFIFSLLVLVLISKFTNLFAISGFIAASYGQFILPILLAFIGFFIVLLAETAHYPFDNPATHLELTMIHEAMILEYSGKRLALMEWASANKFLIFISLGANLFFPWGITGDGGFVSILVSLLIYLIKILFFYSVIAVVESSIAKFRFFRLPDLLVVAFILDIIAISLIK